MKKTAAWLAVHALEQLGIRYTFGIPGVHNTELYDELNTSAKITPVLVTHEGGGAFMAEGFSRASDDSIGVLAIVPAAGLTHAASGIGEAFLDGIPMLVVTGGTRTDTGRRYQLHGIDQLAIARGLTKAAFRIERHADVVPTIYEAYRIATSGVPGPVLVELPVNLQLFPGEAGELPAWTAPAAAAPPDPESIASAADTLFNARRPGIFVGWGARHAVQEVIEVAERLQAPVSTTLQGLAAFPGSHPLHAGFGFSPSAVPAARNAFRDCDALLAVGTRFSEIPTGSFAAPVPEALVHVDIDPLVFNANYPARVAIPGDAGTVLGALAGALRSRGAKTANAALHQQIARDKAAYREEWRAHDSKGRVNPVRFFDELRRQMPADAVTVLDDGNHTFLTAELFTIGEGGRLLTPTDFNAMGYAVPAAIGAKLAQPGRDVFAIVGDGCFMMTCMEIVTAAARGIGVTYFVFHDGHLAQIAQAQQVPYNRKTCTELGGIDLQGVATATGAAYVAMPDERSIATAITQAAARPPRDRRYRDRLFETNGLHDGIHEVHVPALPVRGAHALRGPRAAAQGDGLAERRRAFRGLSKDRHEEDAMGESRPFQVNVPRAVAEQQWQRFRTLFDTTGVGLPEFVEAGATTTHLNFPAGADWASQERIAAEFARFAESDIDPGMPPETSEPTDSMGNVLTRPPRDSGMPLVGRMASPGAPGAGMNDSAGRDGFPRKPS